MSSSCPTCGHDGARPLHTINGYVIGRCDACGLEHLTAIPTDAEIEAHYQNPAYFEGDESQGYASYTDQRKAMLPLFGRRLQEIEEHLPGRGRVLDFGCAAGYF